jgi:hypothetical protein
MLTYKISILMLSSHLHLGLPTNSARIPNDPDTRCTPGRSSNPWFDRSSNIWWRVCIMELLFMQFSPASCHLVLPRSKFSRQHSVLEHPQSGFLSYCERQVSHLYETTCSIIRFKILIMWIQSTILYG